MKQGDWKGVLPAITTPFADDRSVDYSGVQQHVSWLLSEGCNGIVALGSLGEGATLSFDEKVEVLRACKRGMSAGKYLVAGIAGLATEECVKLAREAQAAGCDGLMVLPPYVYKGDWRETKAHFSAVIEATGLSCMLYNNPHAYGTDLLAQHIAELAQIANVHAVKDSSGDARRVSAIREVMGDNIDVLVGLDDMVAEGVAVGAGGWVAGLVNALPRESVCLFEYALRREHEKVRRLNEWFLPLLRFDTGPKFVQLIKLVQARVGKGRERVRAPRLELVGDERAAALAIIDAQLSRRPSL